MAKPPPKPPARDPALQEIYDIETDGRTLDDPRERRRTVPMEVLVLGVSRTATASLRAALLQLGYKSVYHMTEVLRSPRDVELWEQALRHKFKGEGQPLARAEWDMLLGQFQATMDMPSCCLMPELIEAYPEAKVVVCERDEEKWWRSIQATFNARPRSLWSFLLLLDTDFYAYLFRLHRYPLLGPNTRDEAATKRAYRAYYQEVRDLVPEGPRRLEYRLGDGWAPLCRFLGKDVPKDTPFPQLNEGAVFHEAMDHIRARGWARVRNNVLLSIVRFVVVAFVALGPFLFLPKSVFIGQGDAEGNGTSARPGLRARNEL